MTPSTAFRKDIPFINDLGVEFISAENGRAVIALNLAPRHLNSWSVAHGGVTVEMKTNFRLIAKAMGTFKFHG